MTLSPKIRTLACAFYSADEDLVLALSVTPQHPGDTTMVRVKLAPIGLAAAFVCSTGLASAAPFKCPQTGGEFVFGQEANVNSLDQPASSTISTRNIAMNIFETLMTRDENNNPITDLAESYAESPDRLTYTFKLRQGVKFHNGKPMTSADVLASFDRYNKVGLERGMFKNVAGWDAPDASTFVIRMKQAQPTFIEQISSFSVPIVIIPAELKDDPAMQLHVIGTGPWQLVDFTPGSQVKLKRYDGYAPNTKYEERTGFGGYKQACFDTVVFRIVTEVGRSRGRLEDGRTAGRGGPADQVARRSQEGQERHARAAAELVDPDRIAEHLRPADGQSAGAQGGPGGARHGRDHGCRDRRQLQAERRFPVSEPAELHRCRQGDLQHQGSRQGEGVSEAGRIQGRADRAAHQQGLHLDVQRRLGDGGAVEGGGDEGRA